MLAGTFLVVREGFASLGGGPFQIYAGLVALVLNLTVALAGTAALERLGADQSDLPSRLTVRRRPETGANTRLALRLGRIGRGGGTAASLPRPHP